MKEREISLIDLAVEILLKWRVIIVWMLVGGVLMGVFGYFRSYRTVQAQMAQAKALEEQLQQYENEEQAEQAFLKNSLSELQVNNVNTAMRYETLWEEKETYLQESVKMQIDPLNVPRALLTFQVVAEDMETAQRIERLYEDVIAGGLSQWLVDEVQEDISYAAMSELVNLERTSWDLSERTSLILQGESDTFRVVIYHISEEQCMQLADKVDEYLQAQCAQIALKMGNHQIRLVNQEFSYVIDTVLLNELTTIQNSMITWGTNAAKLKDAFSQEEWAYYNFLNAYKQSGDSADGQTEDSTDELQGIPSLSVAKPSVSKKYVLIGMILFAFMYAGYVFVKYIFNGRIRVADDVASLYGVPSLGVIPVEKESRKPFAFVDGWILRLRNWNKRRFTLEEATGLAAVAVKMAAKKEGLKEICCIGCNLKTNAAKAADTIQSVLKDADISMKVLNNALYDQEAMEQLLAAKGVFLMERAGETLYDEVSRELELLRRQEIKVLGIILAE